MNMKSAEDRFKNDPVFHRLVRTMEGAIEQLELTPSEIRAAAMFASIRVEQRNPCVRPLLFEVEERMKHDKRLADFLKIKVED